MIGGVLCAWLVVLAYSSKTLPCVTKRFVYLPLLPKSFHVSPPCGTMCQFHVTWLMEDSGHSSPHATSWWCHLIIQHIFLHIIGWP